MQSVRLHVDIHGTEWAVARCRACANVQWFLASDALAGPVTCESCGRGLDLHGAIITAHEVTGAVKHNDMRRLGDIGGTGGAAVGYTRRRVSAQERR
jgi:hypothetical protein